VSSERCREKGVERCKRCIGGCRLKVKCSAACGRNVSAVLEEKALLALHFALHFHHILLGLARTVYASVSFKATYHVARLENMDFQFLKLTWNQDYVGVDRQAPV